MEFADLFAQAEQLDEYWIDELVTEFTEELARWMASKGISRSKLAERLGNRPSYVTKILKGNVNFTFATVAKLCRTIGARPRLHLAPEGSRTIWYDAIDGWQQRQARQAGPAVTSAAPVKVTPQSDLVSLPQYRESVRHRQSPDTPWRGLPRPESQDVLLKRMGAR